MYNVQEFYELLYFTPDKTDLKIEYAQFINRLKAEWQNIDIRATDNRDYFAKSNNLWYFVIF